MLQIMRNAGLARRLIRGTDLIPDHMGHDRSAAVRYDDHFHAIVEGKTLDVRGKHLRQIGFHLRACCGRRDGGGCKGKRGCSDG